MHETHFELLQALVFPAQSCKLASSLLLKETPCKRKRWRMRLKNAAQMSCGRAATHQRSGSGCINAQLLRFHPQIEWSEACRGNAWKTFAARLPLISTSTRQSFSKGARLLLFNKIVMQPEALRAMLKESSMEQEISLALLITKKRTLMMRSPRCAIFWNFGQSSFMCF